MTYELSQRFYFEAAHSLNRKLETEASRRVHGHTYHARISVTKSPDPGTWMVVDVAHLRDAAAQLKAALDHQFLDDVPGLAAPTLEGLCAFIADKLKASALPVTSVEVSREAAGDSCLLTLATPLR
ncbi:MAG TPA: 6-carboxytetrahydropterin synthase [Rhizobacter sp.]|nr:6-carboxytetrahydropterin synthase [Rhizobacter sp.]